MNTQYLLLEMLMAINDWVHVGFEHRFVLFLSISHDDDVIIIIIITIIIIIITTQLGLNSSHL